jgi:hypothetical protein
MFQPNRLMGRQAWKQVSMHNLQGTQQQTPAVRYDRGLLFIRTGRMGTGRGRCSAGIKLSYYLVAAVCPFFHATHIALDVLIAIHFKD